jgi:hypothetical protein
MNERSRNRRTIWLALLIGAVAFGIYLGYILMHLGG